MPKKVAITIAGAVSLGSYESGVVFEVLDAISQHNRWAEANQLPEERIEVDVLSGASAGGMTAAMIAQRLLFDGPSMSQPYNNPLYQAWVQEVDIAGLLARGADEDVTHSVFSSNLVIGISKTFITGRYQTTPPPAAQPHPALPADGRIQLGLALSNLNGVDYTRTTLSGGTFTYTEHKDQLVRALDRQTGDSAELWEEIRAAAVACGAFPIAFRVQDLPREIGEYASDYLVAGIWGGAASRKFAYSDGGVFQNQPLGMAKNLVEKQPGGHLNAEQRAYIFIAPQPKTSQSLPYTADANADPAKALGSANANYKAVVEGLAGAVVGQSEFRDWIKAEGVNDRLRLLDERAGELQALFASGALTAAETRPVTDVLLNSFFGVQGATGLEAARDQLKAQYQTEYAALGGNAAADAWLDAVLTLEIAANLHGKEEMRIYDFVADPALLASSGLNAFEGFFDAAYRKHDYDYGRLVAQTQLAKYREQPESIFANLHWTPQPIDTIDPGLNHFDMSKVNRAKRQQTYKQMRGAADAMLAELGVPAVLRTPLMLCYVQGKIKKMLAL